ncbi:MAG TPA: peptidoglycan DD-metalloendopeptidase family protein [Vicinamibacterales bacterium]|nr:peptidoglycan DD-metalloendopeptidase family protein [Vicinamibacterales bacterium]
MKFSGTLSRTAAILLLAASGVVASFATIAPGHDVPPPASTPLVEALAFRPGEAVLPAPTVYIREEQFQRGDTLSGFLARLGIADVDVARLVKTRSLHALRPGSNVSAEVSSQGAVRSLSFLTGRDTLVKLTQEGEGFRVAEGQAKLETRVTMKSSVVRSSLFAATDAVGIPDSVAMQLADVFAGDIDFYRDLRKGDRFTVVYEVHHLYGRPVRAGRLLAAEFVNHGKALRAIQFENSYYAPDGKNLRKAFMRSPLEFSRVSSGFGMRMHPIHGAWRAHKGIDYAAPTGTRVRAVGDGIVEHAGPKGGYGNVVILRHHGQYATVYAHLSRVAVRRGGRVAQNDTIGLVGQSGWATGPHLHYEFRIAGEARNPFSIAMPAAQPLASQQIAAFRAYAEPLVARLDLLANSSVALLE